MFRFVYLLLAACYARFEYGSAQSAFTPPPCMESMTGACFGKAIASMVPTACNWYVIIPILSDCVSAATSGCTTAVIDSWLDQINQFNASLNAPGCASSCPNPQESATAMQQCYTVTDSLGTSYSLSAIISSILASSANYATYCPLLNQTLNCLAMATAGCSALTDITFQQLQSMNISQSTAKCGVASFSAATTNAPAAIFDSTTTTAATSTVNVEWLIIAGTPTQQSVSWLILISLGGALIVIIFIITCCFIRQININNKRRRQLLLAEEPTTAEGLARQLGWRLVTTQSIVSGPKPPVLRSSTAFRPQV